MLTRQMDEEVKKSHVIAIAVGFGVAIQNVTFGVFYLVIAELHYYFPPSQLRRHVPCHVRCHVWRVLSCAGK